MQQKPLSKRIIDLELSVYNNASNEGMMKHTPWRYDKFFGIVDASEQVITLDAPKDIMIDIVRCVNSHDVLIEALRQIRNRCLMDDGS